MNSNHGSSFAHASGLWMSTRHNVLASGQSNHPFNPLFHRRDSREKVSANMGIRDYEPKINAVACVRCRAPYKKRKVDRDGLIIEHGYCTNIECKRIAMPSKRVQGFSEFWTFFVRIWRAQDLRRQTARVKLNQTEAIATTFVQIHSWRTASESDFDFVFRVPHYAIPSPWVR